MLLATASPVVAKIALLRVSIKNKIGAVRSLRIGCRGSHFQRELVPGLRALADQDALFLYLWLQL